MLRTGPGPLRPPPAGGLALRPRRPGPGPPPALACGLAGPGSASSSPAAAARRPAVAARPRRALRQLRQLGVPGRPGPGPGSPPPALPPPTPAAAPVRCPVRCRARNASALRRLVPPPRPPAPPQAGQRGGDPPSRGRGLPRLRRHLIPAPARPEQLILGRISRRVRRHRLRRPASASVLLGPVRRLRRDAAIFIPSSATVPSLPIPSRAHSISTSAKTPRPPPGNHPGTGRPSHDRAGSPRRSPGTPHRSRTAARSPATTVTPCAYAHTSTVTSMSGS